MSVPSLTVDQQLDSRSAALARDACFSGDDQPAGEVPAAEPVSPVHHGGEAVERRVMFADLLSQTLRLEMLLSLWRLESGTWCESWQSPPASAEQPPAGNEASDTCCPAFLTGKPSLAQLALQSLGHEAA